MKKQHFNLFIIFFIINLFFSTPKLDSFEAEIITNINSEGFYINDIDNYSECDKWLPSLLTPNLLSLYYSTIEKGEKIYGLNFKIKLPFINHNKEYEVDIYRNVPFLKSGYKGILMQTMELNKKKCYFGISPSINGYTKLNEDNTTLNYLKINNIINKKIFSFDTWKINDKYDSKIKTTFYIGDFNDNFNSNDKFVATCNSYQNDSHWGCQFKEMDFNNIKIQLKNETHIYKIYIASEIHNLIFPLYFEEKIKELSNQACVLNDDNYLSCKNFFNDLDYVPLKLIEENEKFIITGEVDNIIRFNTKELDKKNISKITFEDIDYIILPLSVFKKFHLQFDADNNLISFYANESSILEVKQIEKEESSFSGIIILIIIILILLVLGFGGYWFFIKRRNVEKNINNFSKFEDEEDYKNINEKKVF